MRPNQTPLKWAAFLALLAATLACAPSLPGAGPTATLYVLPTPADGGQAATPSTTAGTDGTGEAGDSDTSGLLDYKGIDTSTLSSYRSEFTMSWTGTDDTGTLIEGSYTVHESYTADPLATYMQWNSTSNQPDQNAQSEIVQIGEVTYFSSLGPDGQPSCISTATQGSTPDQSPAYSPDSFVTSADAQNAKRVLPDEQVNGVLTRHYRMTEKDMTGFAGWNNYVLDIWIAIEGEYPVRETLSADGTLLNFNAGDGHMDWEYNLLDINGAVTITAPEGCAAPVGLDFPTMPDAGDVTTFDTFISYTTPTPLADVVAFYNDQLAPLGWAAGSADTSVPGMATLNFTRGDETVQIIITEANDSTSVFVNFAP